ncbi:hypothetical protein N8T08_004464 [Aspergillus melleus]|uniref:Uncharacterized protein n=1 Tax=Aspergillus melleus TaxID=138277 RepID=A0ACC3B502_9EURO|nr:hypothetical protein N8T08_004464 [Aspergillus melleus]
MLKQTFPSDRGSHDDYLNDNSVLIIDEAQNTYQDEDFWNDRVTLTPQKDPGSPDVGLFYSRTEFDEVVSLASHWNFNEMTAYNDEAKDYLYNLTNGHPGCLDAVMEFIFKEYRSEFKHDDRFVLNEQSLIDVIESDDAATIEGLESSTVSRCFPATASPACAKLLCEVAIHERLEWDSKNMAMVECYQRGWVHRMRIPEQDRHLTLDMCVLPSRLHERYIEYIIGDRTRSVPARFSDLNTLCIEILKTFSKSRLKNSIVGKTLSTAAQPRPLEAQYQDEYYKGFCGLVGKGVPISSEWSRSSAGRVDFWIPGKKWAIELLRDHDNIGGHIGRFKEHGTYHPWLKKREVLDWIVIDCATTLPPPTLYKENIIYAIFTVDYKSLRILDRNKNQLCETISLQN